MPKEGLILNQEKIEGVSSKDNKPYSFEAYYVVVNGIQLRLKPSDETVKQVLKQYYEKEAN